MASRCESCTGKGWVPIRDRHHGWKTVTCVFCDGSGVTR